MKQIYKISLAAVTAVLSLTTGMAQDTGFDLSSQRKESQNILKVPGHKVNHQGIVINPTPQKIEMNVGGQAALDVTAGVRLKDKTKDKKHVLAQDLNFLNLQRKGVNLTVSYASKKNNLPNVEGAYALQIDAKGIRITGRDDKGVFYAVQTLKQLMESPAAQSGKTLPCLSIVDYPTFPYRGVVEGFYGTPWSHKARLSLLDFYGKYKMNTYLYGPKDDPYHSAPNWRKPYPEKERQQIHDLVMAAQRNRVDFVWAIHPGKDIHWNEEDYQNLVRKFEMMYELGVRSFAIFFDDIDGEGTNPMKQVELLNRLTHEFVQQKKDVSPLIVCPTDYSKLWANPSPQGALSIYGRALDPSVKVFWTGDVVCSDVTHETLDWVNQRIQRPTFFWWNYAVTDYVRHIVLQGPVYGFDTTVTPNEMCGLVSNPMEHAEASKLSLYSVADYTWNPKAYNAMDSWERGLQVVAPRSHEAYRTFAIHSADTETGYRRDESWETETFRFNNYTPQQLEALYREFDRIEKVPTQMQQANDNPALLKELQPWLVEFGRLGTRGKRTIDLMKQYKEGDLTDFWTGYVQNIMTLNERKAYEAHRSGTMKLQPFYEVAMQDLSEAFYQQVSGRKPFVYRAVGSYPNLKTTLSQLMFDTDTTSYYTSTASQRTGEWLGVDLGCVKPVREVHILQGRNSVDDVDYFDHATLEYSADGNNWQPLLKELKGVYDVQWQGAEVMARYVRLRKLPSEKKNWTAVRLFEVNPVRQQYLGFKVDAGSQTEAALRAFDEQPTTAFHLSGRLSFDIKPGVSQYALLMRLPANGGVKVSQFDKRGKCIHTEQVTTNFYPFTPASRTTKVVVEGDAEIYEVVMKDALRK